MISQPGGAGGVTADCPVVEDLDGTVLRMLGRTGHPRVAVVRPDRYLLGVFPADRLAGVLAGDQEPG